MRFLMPPQITRRLFLMIRLHNSSLPGPGSRTVRGPRDPAPDDLA